MQSLPDDPVTTRYWRRVTGLDDALATVAETGADGTQGGAGVDDAAALRSIAAALAGDGDATAAALAAVASKPIAAVLRAHARLLEGCLRCRDGDWEAAQLAINRAIESYGDIGLRAGVAVARIELARVAETAGAIDVAVDRYRAARTLLVDIAGDAVEAAAARAALMRQLDDTIAGCTARIGLLDTLLQASAEALPQLLARHRTEIDDDFLGFLRVRSAMLLVDDANVEASIAVAMLCDRVAALRGLPPVRCRDLGQDLLRQRNLRLSARLLEAALDLAPGDHDTRTALGYCLSLQDRVDEAKVQLEAVVGADPHNAVAQRHLGMILLRLGDHEAARTWLERACAANPDDAMASLLLDRLAVAAAAEPLPAFGVSFDPVTKTLAIDDAARALPPDDLAAMMSVAILKTLPEQERADHLAAIAAGGDAALAARVAALLGGSPERPAAFEQAEELFGRGRYEEATTLYCEAIAHDADHADAFSGLADCHFHRGRFHLASAWFEESLAIRPNASVSRFRSHALWSGGRHAEAIAACRQSLATDPSYALARQQLAQMLAAMEGASA